MPFSGDLLKCSLFRRAVSFLWPFSFEEYCVPGRPPSAVEGVDSSLKSVISILLTHSALLHAQDKENRTKCVSTVPTAAFCLQWKHKCCPDSLSWSGDIFRVVISKQPDNYIMSTLNLKSQLYPEYPWSELAILIWI